MPLTPQTSQTAIPNPLLEHQPELLERLSAFRLRVNDMLLDKLAAATLRDPAFRARQCPHPLEDIKATVQVLRVLTRQSWDRDDLELLDACWRQATQSALFGEEFEPERHRLRHVIDAGRRKLPLPHRMPERRDKER